MRFECDADEPVGQQALSWGGRGVGGAGVGGAGAAPASSGAGRHSYFRARKLQRAALAF